jgi:hypothetical protein
VSRSSAWTINAIKQAAEFGLGRTDALHVAALLLQFPDVHALGLEVAQGLTATETFVWDLDDHTRAAATIRRPTQADAVRAAAVGRISSGVTRGEDRNQWAAISPARLPPTWRNTNAPVSTTLSNKVAPASSRRASPKNPMRNPF